MANPRFKLSPMSVGLTLTERVYETIKVAILDLRYRPGTPLVEDDLARQLGTSKTPVRDALLTLERDGLVTKIPYRGTYVSEVSLRDAAEIFELRAVLEGLASSLATREFSPHDLDDAERLLDEADRALAQNDRELCSTLGAQFHTMIHERAANRRLIPILDKLEEQLRRLRKLSDRLQGRLEKSGLEHRRILAGLRTGDPQQAEAAMRAHLDSVARDFAQAGPLDAAPPVEILPTPAEVPSL